VLERAKFKQLTKINEHFSYLTAHVDLWTTAITCITKSKHYMRRKGVSTGNFRILLACQLGNFNAKFREFVGLTRAKFHVKFTHKLG
ncbi:uncharacterized protein METZ01_LOCUS186779, partial [marine metagenome]